jgi:hypothetical protein
MRGYSTVDSSFSPLSRKNERDAESAELKSDVVSAHHAAYVVRHYKITAQKATANAGTRIRLTTHTRSHRDQRGEFFSTSVRVAPQQKQCYCAGL